MADWSAYVDSVKQRAPNDMGGGAIVGKKEGSIYCDVRIGIQPEEARVIAQCFRKRNFKAMETHGFTIRGQKYGFLFYNKDQDCVVGRAKGRGGMHLQGTKTAVLIAECLEGKQMGVVNKAVGEIGQHLVGSNF